MFPVAMHGVTLTSGKHLHQSTYSSCTSQKRTCLEKSFPLDMLSAVILSQRSYLTMLWAKQLVHQWLDLSNPLVLRQGFLSSFSCTPGRIQTVSRRSKLNSGRAFIGEQPNPWNLLQLQDALSQHRGAKLSRRYGLLAKISLLSLE